MNSDPAVVAAATIANSIKGSYPLPHELAQVIREAYAPTLDEQIKSVWAVINGGPCPCCGQAEGNMCRCAAFASLLAAKDAMVNEANAERDRLAAEVERLQRELAAADDESAKRGSEILDLQQKNAELRKELTECDRIAGQISETVGVPCDKRQYPILRAASGVDQLLAEVAKNVAAKVSELQRDAERLKYVEENHARAHSLHMDGTFCWSFRGLLNGRVKTFREAIDAAMKEAK